MNRTDFPVWDYVILTASNEAQAESYRRQIALRVSKGLLTDRSHYAVLPDPDGLRVGSGGATLNVLRHIRQQSDTFEGKRILCDTIREATANVCRSTARWENCFRLYRGSFQMVNVLHSLMNL